jgi:hypothetical protein
LKGFIVELLAGIAVPNRIQTWLNRLLKNLHFLAEVGRVLGLNRVLKLDVQSQNIPQSNNASLKRVSGIGVRLSSQTRLLFDLTKEGLQIVE